MDSFDRKYEGVYEKGVKKFIDENKIGELINLGINPQPLNNDAGIEVTAADTFASGLNFQLARWINALKKPEISGFQVVNQGDPDQYVYDSNNYNLVYLSLRNKTSDVVNR